MKYFSWLLSVTSKIKVKTIVVTLREKLKIIKEKILSNRFYLWLFTGSVTLLCFLLPSIIYSFIEKTYRVKFFGYEFFLFFVPMAFSLAATRTITACFLLFFFMLLELMQFGHLIYFGFHLNPFSIELATTGITDIVDVLLGLIGKVWHLPFLVLIPYCLLIALYKKTSKHRAQYYIVVVILFYFVSKYYCEMELISNEVFKHVENLGDIQVNTLMPIDTKISLDNSLKSFSAFLYDRLPAIASGKKIIIKKKYDEYIIEKNNVDKPVNIILIVGESVNSERMSLFDYERDTTPLLKKMSLEDENFVFKKALSSSVLTHISLNFLINIQREPDNIEHLLSRKADMFKLAKNNGFSTAYISAHNDRLLASISVSDVGKIITNKTGLKEKIKEHGEIYFVRYIKEIIKEELLKTDKNFLVIHLRTLHAPYNEVYEQEGERFDLFGTKNTLLNEFRSNTYDNAMLYNDYVLDELLNIIKEETESVPTYVFFVSDHSETFEERIYGHGFLSEGTPKIPFFATTYWTKDGDLKKELEELFYPTHYEIGKIIAKKLGYKITNPNEEEGIFYVNGVNTFGLAGYLIIKKDPINKRIEFVHK